MGLTDFFVFFIVVLGVLDRFACQGSFVFVRPRWGRGGEESDLLSAGNLPAVGLPAVTTKVCPLWGQNVIVLFISSRSDVLDRFAFL